MSMYKIYSDGVEIEDVLSPVLTVEANKAGSMTFTLLPGHPLYDSMTKLKTIITVTQSGEEIFRGRVLDDTRDFYNRKEITVEGELAFLNDSVQLPFKYNGKLNGLIQQYIANHNAMVEEEKQFTFGTMTVDDVDVKAETGDYGKTFELMSEVIDSYGGYLIPRLKYGVRYLDYVKDYVKQSEQRIEFAVNLLDLKEHISAESICTVIYPTTTDSKGGLVTIAEENGGVAYIENAEGIAQYGRIVRHVELKAANAADLLTMARKYMNQHSAMINTITINAVDLHHVNVSAEKLRVGHAIRVVSAPHNLDRDFTCTRIEYHLEDPSQNTYTLGMNNSSMLDRQISSTVALKRTDVKNVSMLRGIIYNTVSELDEKVWTNLIQTSKEIKMDAHNEYLDLQSELLVTAGQIRSEVQNTKEGLESSITQTESRIQAQVNDANGNISRIDQTYDGIRQQILQNNEVMAEINQTVAGIDAWSKDTEGNLGDLLVTAKAIQGKVSDVEGNVGNLMLASDQFRVTLQNGDMILSEIQQLQDQINLNVNSANGTIGSLSVKADSITQKIETAEHQISQLVVNTDGMVYTLSKAGETLAKFEVNQEHMMTQIGNAESSIGTLEVMADSITAKVEDVNKGVSQFKVTADAIRGEVTDLSGRTGKLELRSDRFAVEIGKEGLGGKIELLEGVLGMETSAGGNTVAVRLNAMDDSINLKANKTYVDNLVANKVTSLQADIKSIKAGDFGSITLKSAAANIAVLNVASMLDVHGVSCKPVTMSVGGKSFTVFGTDNINFNIADTQEYKDGVSAAYEQGKAEGGGGGNASNIDLSSFAWIGAAAGSSAVSGRTRLSTLGSLISSHKNESGYITFTAKVNGGTGTKFYYVPMGSV